MTRCLARCGRRTPAPRLLEIGAGTGQDSSHFQHQGFAVAAADLSAAMVERCRAKGIEAHASTGAESAEGPLDDDKHVPPRFFSWRTDEQLLDFAADARFDVVDFHPRRPPPRLPVPVPDAARPDPR